MLELRPGSVKICSLREVEHAQLVLDVDADLFGLIFVPGRRRQVSYERAREIVIAVRQRSGRRPPLAVGVFVDAPAAEISAVVRSVGLDIVQLHGGEPPELLDELEVPAIKAIAVDAGQSPSELDASFRAFAAARRPPLAFLIDGPGGGMGRQADWTLASEIARERPVMLAGGLTPGNVGDAIAAVRPLAVDVSSGVETDGIKDPAKVAAFVARARAGFSSIDSVRAPARSLHQ